MAALTEVPIGELLITTLNDPVALGPILRIDRADPHVWITDEVIEAIVRSWEFTPRGWGSPFGRLDYAASPRGAVLTLTGTNRTVIYLLSEYDRQRNRWLAVWPD